MTKEVEIVIICNQCSMACIFNTVLLDLSVAMTDSFEGRGAYSREGLIGGFTVIGFHCEVVSNEDDSNFSEYSIQCSTFPSHVLCSNIRIHRSTLRYTYTIDLDADSYI